MPRPPNYNQERKERDRAKAAKKAEKLAARAAKTESRQTTDMDTDNGTQAEAPAERE